MAWASSTPGGPSRSPPTAPPALPSPAASAAPPLPGLEVVRGVVMASGRIVTGGTVSGGGHASFASTPELWVATPAGPERRLVGRLLSEARPGHEIAVVLQDRKIAGVPCQEPVLLANLSTDTTWVDRRADPERALTRRPVHVLLLAILLVPLLALPWLIFVLPVVANVVMIFVPRAAEDAVSGPLIQILLWLEPLACLWLAPRIARWDRDRRSALLDGAQAALRRAGVPQDG